MGYTNKTVTKKRREQRTRILPGGGTEVYFIDVPYTVVESVYEPDNSGSSTSYESPSYGGE